MASVKYPVYNLCVVWKYFVVWQYYVVIHKPISFVFLYTSFVKLIPRLWRMAEEEGTGMRNLQGVFIIREFVLDHLVTKIHWSVEDEKKRTNAYPNTWHGCHPQSSTLVLAIARWEVQRSDCSNKSSNTKHCTHLLVSCHPPRPRPALGIRSFEKIVIRLIQFSVDAVASYCNHQNGYFFTTFPFWVTVEILTDGIILPFRNFFD